MVISIEAREELKRLEAEAPQGPWDAEHSDGDIVIPVQFGEQEWEPARIMTGDPDSTHLAAALRNHAKELLSDSERLAELEAENKIIREDNQSRDDAITMLRQENAALEAKCEGLEEHNIELQKQCSSLADQLAAFTSDSNIGKQYGEPCDQGDKEAPPCANSPSSPEPGAEGKTE